MRLLPIGVCQPGMRLAKRIFNEEGVILLGENVSLTATLIRRLKICGIHFVYIKDSRTEDIVIPDLLSEETQIKAMGTIRSHFRHLMEAANNRKSVQVGAFAKSFRHITELVIGDLSTNQNAMIMLNTMQVTDHYLYQHSLNVCVYASILGMHSGYTGEQMITFSMGALLHDIGKTRISEQTLKKPGKLTDEEYEAMKKHTEFGFAILKDEPNVPLLAAHCALQHHERINGSGYPRGLKGEEIHEYAHWIGLADSFDAMTTNRAYRAAMLPHQAMESLYAGSGSLYDLRKIELFRDKIAIYPIGLSVVLSTGEIGVVVRLNVNIPHRPIVRVLHEQDGSDIRTPYEIDLSKIFSVMITDVQQAAI